MPDLNVEGIGDLGAVEAALRSARLVFWDFDGVIKESLDVKSTALQDLFAFSGADVATRVRAHHECHGGMSRYEKMPLYLQWAGLTPTAERVAEYSARFGDAVRQAVIDAAWVPGVESYLRKPRGSRTFVLVTATPLHEMAFIVDALKLGACFDEIWGAPTPKAEAVAQVLRARRVLPESCLMVGDSEADCAAARANAVPFVLRRTPYNTDLQEHHAGPSFRDLLRSSES